MKKVAIIVAGGSGQRMAADIPKQFLLIHNKPLLWYTVSAFLSAYEDLHIVLVMPAAHLDRGKKLIDSFGSTEKITMVSGGETRFASVKNGLESLQQPALVAVHDGVRCLITAQLIRSCFEYAEKHGNAVAAVPATDSMRIETGQSNKILDRANVRIIQTPQVFQSKDLIRGFAQEYKPAFTDEASVVESLGISINLVEGDMSNIKVTHPPDLLLAEAILARRG